MLYAVKMFKPTFIFGFVAIIVSIISMPTASASLWHHRYQEEHPVHDYGISFTFAPETVCEACLQSELGYGNASDNSQTPAVLTFAPNHFSNTDISLFFNATNLSPDGLSNKTILLGNNINIIIRQRFLNFPNMQLTIAPTITGYLRGYSGARLGATLGVALMNDWWRFVLNIAPTGATNPAVGNPSWQVINAIDFFANLAHSPVSLFTGFHQLSNASASNRVGTEVGMIVAPRPFWQLQAGVQFLSMNQNPYQQIQLRAIVNWGRIYGKPEGYDG